MRLYHVPAHKTADVYKRQYLPNALLREYIAVSAMGKRRHLAVCGIIALGSAMLAAAAALK